VLAVSVTRFSCETAVGRFRVRGAGLAHFVLLSSHREAVAAGLPGALSSGQGDLAVRSSQILRGELGRAIENTLIADD
jgi:hypothetical protein